MLLQVIQCYAKTKRKMVIRLDRFTKAMLVLLVVGVYGLLLSLIFQGQPVVAQGTDNVVKWEYNWLENGRIEGGKRMDELGKKGWEMFAATVDYNNNGVQYYKRRIN
jgi:hypothetical protein